MSLADKLSYGAVQDSGEVDVQRNYPAINESIESDSQNDEENNLLGNLKPEEELKTSKSIVRFYILLLFCGFTFMQGMIWNNWGPIADSAEVVYKWDRGGSTIALLSNWGPIAFIPGTLVFPIVINWLGFRYGILLGMFLTCVGAVLRIFTTSFPVATILMHIAHILNGFAGPASMGGTTTISANWFPHNERTLSTSIGGAANYMGVAISFIIGPLMVRQVNGTNVTATELSEVTTDVFHMLYIMAAVCVVLFLSILVYYPSKPKHPPSLTAEVTRLDFIHTLLSLFTNVPFWVLFLCYGITTGVNSSWSAFLFPNLSMLKEVKVTQVYVGWLGFYSTLSGSVGTVVVGFISDRWPKWKKTFIVILTTLAGITASLFTLFCDETIKVGDQTYLVITLTGILLNLFINSTIGIYYELSAEVCYPVPEATGTIIFALANNLAGFVFLLLAQFPQLGTIWMNYCQAVSFFCIVPFLIFTPIRYKRLNKDTVD